MPTYDYRCDACGVMEIFHSIKDPPMSVCPRCGRAGLSRCISKGAGVIFKGSGFWETDYNRSSDYQKQSKAESGGEAKSATGTGAAEGGASAASSESKPAPSPSPAADKPE